MIYLYINKDMKHPRDFIKNTLREFLNENQIDQIRNTGLSLNNKIQGGFLNKKQAEDLQKEIESNYDDGIIKFGQDSNDIRKSLYNYHNPLAEKNINGVNLRITDGLIEGELYSNNRRKTYLLYADGNIVGKFYKVNDIKKAIKYIEINDIEFLNKIDENLINQFGEEEINNRIKKNFLRFLKIRYEYISSYFTNQFNINDLEIIFNSFQVLNLPISKNNCNTIEKLVDVKKDKFFIKNLYENLKNSSQNFKTKINNEVVSICFNNKTFKLIEDKIISYIEKKTESDFNKLIYGKIN